MKGIRPVSTSTARKARQVEATAVSLSDKAQGSTGAHNHQNASAARSPARTRGRASAAKIANNPTPKSTSQGTTTRSPVGTRGKPSEKPKDPIDEPVASTRASPRCTICHKLVKGNDHTKCRVKHDIPSRTAELRHEDDLELEQVLAARAKKAEKTPPMSTPKKTATPQKKPPAPRANRKHKQAAGNSDCEDASSDYARRFEHEPNINGGLNGGTPKAARVSDDESSSEFDRDNNPGMNMYGPDDDDWEAERGNSSGEDFYPGENSDDSDGEDERNTSESNEDDDIDMANMYNDDDARLTASGSAQSHAIAAPDDEVAPKFFEGTTILATAENAPLIKPDTLRKLKPGEELLGGGYRATPGGEVAMPMRRSTLSLKPYPSEAERIKRQGELFEGSMMKADVLTSRCGGYFFAYYVPEIGRGVMREWTSPLVRADCPDVRSTLRQDIFYSVAEYRLRALGDMVKANKAGQAALKKATSSAKRIEKAKVSRPKQARKRSYLERM